MKALMWFAVLCLMSLTSYAQTPFEKHFLAVSQSMSSFYMYTFSDGDERYLEEFEHYKNLASQSLMISDLDSDKKQLKRWKALAVDLYYKEVKGMGMSLDRVIRLQYRAYLIELYTAYVGQPKQKVSASTLLTRVQLFHLLLSARALDVASSDMGRASDSLDQHGIALQIETDLNQLINFELQDSQIKDLRRVRDKFQFMKKSLVDYEAVLAYFLLYRNIFSVNKLLDASQRSVAVANN